MRKIRVLLHLPLDASYWRSVVRGIARACQAHPGWMLYPIDGHESLDHGLVAGHDVLVAVIDTPAKAREILKLKIPVINVSYLDDARITKVGNDDDAIGRMGAEHLLQCGFSCLSFIGKSDLRLCRRRQAAFRQAVEGAGRVYMPFSAGVHRGQRSKWRKTALRSFIQSLPQPAAVMAEDDSLALLVAQMAAEVGRRVPDDLAILGVNNDDLVCEMSRPQLSSVELAFDRMGEEIVQRIESLLHGNEKPGRIAELPPLRVAVRRSTDVLAVDDDIVMHAVRFIRQNAFRPLAIQDILDEVPVSRSSLLRRFGQALGHAPQDEIRHGHLEIAKRLLANEDCPLKVVASKCGLQRPQRLAAVFKKYMGVTPGEFRRYMQKYHHGRPRAGAI